MYCPKCGSQIPEGDKFCQNCGYSTEEKKKQAPRQAPKQTQAQQAPPPQTVVYKYALPAENEPLSPWAFWGLRFVYTIPLVGFICLIVLSFHSNVNLKNFTRSYWCSLLVSIIFIIIVSVVLVATGGIDTLIEFLENLEQYLGYRY